MEYKLIKNNNQEENSITEYILRNRGIEDPYHYLHTAENDLNDPLLLNNLDKGVKMLFRNILEDKKTVLIVD